MRKIEYFDYPKVARQLKVPDDVLKKIEREVKTDFPSDKMMFELHVLRAIKSRHRESRSYKRRKEESALVLRERNR